jgi:RNA polymerase sigma factor (sigma-70 family)
MSGDNKSQRTPRAAGDAAEPVDVARPTWTGAELDAAMAKVPAYEREIFMLHVLDGLSYLEIATRYGISVGRVERALIKALMRLRRAIDAIERRRR